VVATSYKGHDKIIQLLLKKGANINTKGGEHGNTRYTTFNKGYNKIMHFSQRASYIGEIQADQTVESDHSDLLVQWGTRLPGHVLLQHLLLKKGANINTKGGKYRNALQAAMDKEHNKIIKLLLKKGANINTKGRKYGTALHITLKKGYNMIYKVTT
jgi:ankyrin repeat protein